MGKVMLNGVDYSSSVEDTGDSKKEVVTFSTFDVNDDQPNNSWTTVQKLTSGETHALIMQKISMMFKNIRYLRKKIPQIVSIKVAIQFSLSALQADYFTSSSESLGEEYAGYSISSTTYDTLGHSNVYAYLLESHFDTSVVPNSLVTQVHLRNISNETVSGTAVLNVLLFKQE